MIRFKVLCVLATVALAGSAFGSIHMWDGGAEDDNPTAATNWVGNTGPSTWTAGDVGIIDTDIDAGGFTWGAPVELRFDGSHTYNFSNAQVFFNGGGKFTVTNGATVSSSHDFHIGSSGGGFFEISSGSVTYNRDLDFFNASVANQSGGSVVGTGSRGGTPFRLEGNSVYNFSGGELVLERGDIDPDIADGSYLNFTTGSTGEWTIEADDYDFGTLVANGAIRSNGLTTTMDAFDIDNSVGGETTISLIPEPATFGLLGIFGLVYLLWRKLSN